MDTLRRRPVVRESEVFAALFPRAFSPQQQQQAKGHEALPTLPHGAASKVPDDGARSAETAIRVPKLGALSPKTPRALMTTLPMTAGDGAVVWKFLCDWVTAQIAMEAPAAIPGFGTVTMRTQALKIRMPFFDPDRAFLEKHGLRVESAPVALGSLPRAGSSSNLAPREASKIDVLSFSYMEMAACCGKHVDVARAKDWLQTALQKLGEAMRQCERVEFDVGVGVVACTNRVVETHMLPRHTSTTSKIPFEVRQGESVVKRSLMIPSSPNTARDRSYLSGATFSPAIRLHAAVEKDANELSDLFTLDGSVPKQKKPLRSLVPGSPAASIGASPRTQRLKNGGNISRPQDSEVSSIASAVGFPALFDMIARTYCVEPDLNLSFLQPSNRIASNFAPIATRLIMVKHAQRSGTNRNEGPFLTFIKEAIPCDPPYPEEPKMHSALQLTSDDESPDLLRRRAASEERYFAYLDSSNRLMDVRWLAPLAQDLVDRIVKSAIKYLSSAPSGHMKSVFDGARDEFVSNYHMSVKKAILDYLLLRIATRERLGIPFGTPSHTSLPSRWQWGNNKGVNGCMSDLKTLASASRLRLGGTRPLSPFVKSSKRGAAALDPALHIKKRRRKRVKTRLASAFMLTDPQIRALQYMWYDFEANLLLVKLPDPRELSEKMEPIDLHAFERTQLAHASQMRAFVMEHWYQRARDLFEQSIARLMTGSFNNGDVIRIKHIFNAVAVQMSLQIRSLILKSIRAYAAFFETFGGASDKALDDGADDMAASSEAKKRAGNFSALLVSLSLQDGDIQFRTPLIEIPSMLVSILHNLPQLFHNLNRVETQFQTSLEPLFTSPGGGSHYSPFLWNVNPQETEIVKATARIRQIIEQNLIQLHELRVEYTAYGAAYRRISSGSVLDGSETMDEAFTSDKMEQWRCDLQDVRNTVLSLLSMTRSSRHLNLFSVDCERLSNDLLRAFSSWIHQQLSSFAEGTASFNSRLRQQYKEVAARLAKRPLDLYELVEAEAFVDSLKSSKLHELQVKVEDVKQRMLFLLFHREAVHVHGPADLMVGATDSKSDVFSLPNELLGSTAKTIRWRTHIERLLLDAEAALVGERARIEAIFLAKRNRCQAEIEEFDAEVKSFSKKGDLRHAATYVVQLTKMKEALVGFKRQMESIAEEEAKLQWKPTDFSKLDDIAEEMEPYERLWKTARDFRELNSRWLRTNIFELQAHEGLQSLQQMMSTISTVSNQLQLNSAAAAITAEMVKKQMGDFRENARIVGAILNPCVQERHLKEISTLLALTVDPVEPITLLKLLENGAFDHLARIVDISETATMEKQIEEALRVIGLEWDGVRILFKAEKASSNADTRTSEESAAEDRQRMQDTTPLSLSKASVNDIKLLVEDHQLRLQTLQCLPHAIPFTNVISRWLLFLHDVYLILDLMVSNERQWKRIVPLFSAGIIDDEAEECTLFAQADAIHRSVCRRVEAQPVCLELVYYDPSDFYQIKQLGGGGDEDDSSVPKRHQVLLSDLKRCRELLEKAGNNISVGFETRRSHFPRFYLLSDNELVAALATRAIKQSGTPASSPELWRYLRLCFPGIHHIQTSVQRELTAFVSARGEQVPISTPIPTVGVALATWLAKLETSMATILQACTRAAINDFARKEFRKWCLLWPEQVLLCTVLHTWTMQGELYNKKSSPGEAAQAWRAEAQSLADKVGAVNRELKAAATSSTRLSLSSVVLLLHQLRDVSTRIAEELAEYPQVELRLPEEEQEVTSSGSFAHAATPVGGPYETTTWLAHPRFYYDAGAALGVKVMSFAAIPYGFEYCGNASPPVYIMPMTLRCFHAFVLHAGTLNRGSIMSGPAGVGKKTTCMTLARLCGRLMIQFDCADKIQRPALERFHALVDFLKGAVSCGAWLMMTSLRHLEHAHSVALLATICSQVMDCHAAKLAQCTVLGAKLKLKKGVHFIAVSHGAPGVMSKSTTTDAHLARLRSAFRPVEVSAHDLGLITEFFLLEENMIHSKDLAKLINAVLDVITREIELLDTQGGDTMPLLRSKAGNVRALQGIVRHVAQLCAQERQALCSAHSWPPSVAPSSVTSATAAHQKPHVPGDTDMPVALVRDLETLETKATCVALREFAGSFLPSSSSVELIDFVLRDFAAKALGRDLRVSRSFLIPTRSAGGKAATVDSALLPSAQALSFDVERAIHQIVQDTTMLEQLSIDAFPQRVVQVYQALQNHRAVVVLGDVQSGKTAVWEALAEAVNKLRGEGNENTQPALQASSHSAVWVARTLKRARAVVVYPRAISCDQLLGSPSRDGVPMTDTLIAHLIRDAKSRWNDEDTWLVFDGDISGTWADRMLQATEASDGESDADTRDGAFPSSSRLPGLQLPSRAKRTSMPHGMRLLIETTVLKDVSPAFIAKVGVVHTGRPVDDPTSAKSGGKPRARGDWRYQYTLWKRQHQSTFAALHDELYSLLDTLMDETVDASLEFVASKFGAALHLRSVRASPSLLRWRVRSFLALLHSLLLQSWAKLSIMVSGKQRKTAIHCYFLQALVWGIGHTSDSAERHKFHTFLRQWIITGPRSADSSLKRALILFFPSGTMGSAAAGLAGASGTQLRLDLMGGGNTATATKETLYNFGFSIELGSKWMRWPDFFDVWMADKCQVSSNSFSNVGGSPRRRSAQSAVPESSTITDQSLDSRSLSFMDSGRHNRLFVRTPSMAAAVYLMHQLTASGYPTLFVGPQDAGKSTCGRVGLNLHEIIAEVQRNNASASGGTNRVNERADGVAVPNEFVYSGASVSARCILEQLGTFVERKRVQQRRHTTRKVKASAAETGQEHRPAIDISSPTLVFVDDLHCVPPDKSSENALELLRGIVERNEIVHPTANTIMDCGGGLALTAALRHDGGRQVSQELLRLSLRFVPIAVPAVSDIELSSICSAFVASRTMNHVEDQSVNALSSDSAGFSSAAQETSQLVTALIKATIKLFRVLSSDQWTFSSSHHLHMASASQASKNYAAYTAFQPSKAHYVFHMQDILRVMQHVCCDGRQSLSIAETPQIAKLWCHEAARVFGDRLSDDNDFQQFYNLLQDTVVSSFNLAPDGLLATTMQGESMASSSGSTNPKNHAQLVWLRDQLFFSFIGESSGAGMVDGYREVHELQKVALSIERSMMGMYRANVTTESLPLVLCTHAIRHILRLTRVLRHNDQHMLLIGRRGSKMETIVRLAAFICRKSTTSYCVPRGQDGERVAWKAVLKAALLQCARQPRDDRLVFILKDMWLEDLTIYAALDRYFSGSKLLSDIISYEDFDESILQTLRCEADRERRGDSETPTVAAQDAPSTAMYSKSSIVSFFFDLVRRKLQFVLIFSLPPEVHESSSSLSSSTHTLAQLMWQYPFIQKTCVLNYVCEWPEESLHSVAQKCFAPVFATERDRLMQLSQVSVQMYMRTRAAWPVWVRDDKLEGEDNRRPRTSGEGGSSGARAFASLPKPGNSLGDRPCSLIQVEPSMLIEQISLFLAHLPRLQCEVEAGRAKYAAGLAFMERTEQILALGETQQQLLEPEMAKKTAATRRMSGNLEKEKLVATKVHHSLEMETALVESQRVRLEQAEVEYETLVGGPRDCFAQKTENMRPFEVAMAEGLEDGSRFLAATSAGIDTEGMDLTVASSAGQRLGDEGDGKDDVGSNSERRKEAAANRQRRAMIRTFVGILQPATSLRQLAECVGLMFGIEPVESRDELDPEEIVMNYWGSVIQQMQTEAFWHELVGFDVRTRMTERTVARTLLICTSPEFDAQLFTTIHELAVLLCEWVQACAVYAREMLLAEPKYAQLCQERHTYDTAIAQMRARQVEMQTQASTTSNASTMRHVSEQERKELDARLKDNSSTLQMATSVWKVLEPCKSKWRTLYEHFTEFGAQAMGDLMLATATMAYASSATSHTRARLRSLWSDELNKHFVVHSALAAPRPIHQLFSVDDRTLTKWQVDGLPSQESACLESGVLAMHSFLFPVIIDPHRVATEWLEQQLSDLANSDASDEDKVSVAIISGRTADRRTVWQTLSQCVKKKKPLLVEDFNEALAADLLSVLQSKRRSRFDSVNQDITSVASRASASPSDPKVGVMRRRSSISIGLGINTGPKKRSITGGRSGGGFGVFGNNRCWFEAPVIGQAKAVTSKTVVECSSDSCLVYFVYSDHESIPAWLAPLASCVSLIRFEFSPAQMKTKCVQTILDSRAAHSQALTEIHALRMGTIACDEQIESIENEILDFFSVEDPVDVYGDTAKALKIVGNRSALHTLEGSKLESNKRIQHHYLRLACFSSLFKRSIDMVATWRDLSACEDALPGSGTPTFPIEWIWKSLTHAITRAEPASTQNQVGLFTASVRQCVRAEFPDSQLQLLFDLLLGLRVNERRRIVPQNRLSDETIINGPYNEEEGIEFSGELEAVLPRLVQLLECKEEAQVRTLCAGVSSKLLTARPSDVISVHKWRALCFLAEKLPSLKELMTTLQQQQGGKDAWKDALALDQLLAETTTEWSPKVDVDLPARLCFIAALKKSLFVHEIEAAAVQELDWVCQQAPSVALESEQAVQVSDIRSVATLLSLTKSQTDEAPKDTPMVRAWLRPHSIGDLWKIYSSASSPIVVICRAETDFTREVSDVAAQAKVTLDLSTQEATTSETFEQSLLQSVQKGQWVVLPHFDAHPEWRNIVSHVLTTLPSRDPHPDFRLWLSVLDRRHDVLIGSDIVVMRLVKTNADRFSDALRHAFLLIESHLPRIPTRPSPTKHSAISSEKLLHVGLFARFGVFHALVSCRGLLPRAPWKLRGFEFGEDALVAVLQTAALARYPRQQDTVVIQDHVRTLTLHTYSAGLRSPSEQLLLSWCVELVFGKEAVCDSLAVDAANRTMPEVAQVLRALNELPASGTIAFQDYAASVWNVITSSAIEPNRLVVERRVSNSTRGLRRVLESRGLLKPTSAKPVTAQSTPSRGGARANPSSAPETGSQVVQTTMLLLEALSRFASDLEGYDLDESVVAEKFPREYKRPLNQLVQREIECLRVVQSGLVNAIRSLQTVANASETPTPHTTADFACLMRGQAPPSWLALLAWPTDPREAGTIALEDFQLTILERMRFFQSWLDLGVPNRFLIDKFQSSIECVFEVIHQHFVRNLVGDIHCDGARHCIRIVRMFEDKGQVQLPARDDVVYVSGWRLFGHLQAEIVPVGGPTSQASMDQRKRSAQAAPRTPQPTSGEIREEGTPVIMEITTKCLITTHQIKADSPSSSGSVPNLLPQAGPTNINVSSRRSSIAPSHDFPCPIYSFLRRDSGGVDGQSAEDQDYGFVSSPPEIAVPSSLPVPQLVFSGSHLSVCSSLGGNDRF